MMLPPFSAPQGFVSALSPPDGGEAIWFLFSGNNLLVGEDQKTLPSRPQLTLKRFFYMGTFEGKSVYAGEAEAPPSPLWRPLRSLHGSLSDDFLSLAGRAMLLLEWDRSNQFCGRCGSATFARQKERCRECSACGHTAYPKLAPAVMALVKKGDQILLARSPHFPEKMYSVIAGFVDPGETLEQCVVREVREEVGIRIKNVRYFGSQPWPFSHSLMIAFTCEWEAGEIAIDPLEIEDAAWFERSHLPQLASPSSLSRILIESFVEEEDLVANEMEG